MNPIPRLELRADLPTDDDVDLASLPADAVIVWFDADLPPPIAGRRWVVVGFDAEAAWPDRPYVEPFFSSRIGYANEIEIALTGYGFDASKVLLNGVPSPETIGRLGAELFDLYAAWAGLNYARINHHKGPVLMLGDGTGAIRFMQRRKGLDLLDRGVDTLAMRDLIEELYSNFTSVTWKWIRRNRNRGVEAVQDRLKLYLKTKVPGPAVL